MRLLHELTYTWLGKNLSPQPHEHASRTSLQSLYWPPSWRKKKEKPRRRYLNPKHTKVLSLGVRTFTFGFRLFILLQINSLDDLRGSHFLVFHRTDTHIEVFSLALALFIHNKQQI